MRVLLLASFLLGSASILMVSPALAFVYRIDSDIYLTENYDEDLLLLANSISIDGVVQGDIFAAAQTLNLGSELRGSLTCVGQRVAVDGPVRRSVRAAAQSFRVNSMISGDLLAAAQDVRVGAEAVIMRDVILTGLEVILDGTVEGDCQLSGGRVTVSGRVYGNTSINANEITISPQAILEGDLEYESETRAQISPEARILGDTRFKKRTSSTGPDVELPLAPPPTSWLWSFLFFCGTCIMGLVLILFKRDLMIRITMDMKSRFLLHGLLGLALIVVTPIFLIMLAILPLGWPIVVTGATVYTLTFVLAKIFVGVTLGWVLLSLGRHQGRPSLGWSLLLGMAALALLFKIPVVGWIVYGIAWAIGAGALTFCFFRRKTVVVGADAANSPEPGTADH